jgi:hypothetical protein
MSEQELREGLWAAVADEPALAFDPDALMEQARREIKRRRALFGAGTATVAVAVAAVAVPAMLGVPRTGHNAGGSGPGGCLPASATEPSDPSEIPVPTEPPGMSFKVTVPGSGMPPTFVPTGSATAPPSPEPTTPVPAQPSAPPCPPTSGERPTGPMPPASSSSASANPSAPGIPWPPPDVKKRQYTAAQLKARGADMKKYLTINFGRTVAGATNLSVQDFGGEASGAVADGQSYLETFVGYTLNGASSAVDIAAYAPGEGPTPTQACDEGSCTVQQLTAGDTLVTTKINAGDRLEIVAVTHYRTDGAVVRASGYNYDPSGKAPPKVLPEIPVTVAQLTKLATDPALGI